MEAFHSLWTKPRAGEGLEDYELLTLALSALKWREKNGAITLVTDTPGLEYIWSSGYLPCWSRAVINLDTIPAEIDPLRFWAAGKIYALKSFEAPVVSIDTDFIVWESLNLERSGSRLCAIHSETLTPEVYPDSGDFTVFDDGFNWEVLPLNAAFLYFGDEELKNAYVSYATGFMTSCRSGDTLRPMVFAEQRLLAMTAHKMGVTPGVFSSLEKLSAGKDERFTHLWGFKKQLRESEAVRDEFTQRLKARLIKDFAQYPKWCFLQDLL
ncbi:MAG: hypothetical protein IJ300_06410 [Clostridia bacterium]|nr:hypothetical protein [Clostridia bacterium]